MFAPGTVISGKYLLERPLAKGGMGSLWVARHTQLGQTVAIKFLDATFAESPAHRARFEREARASATLRSPHVIQVHDFGFEGAAPYLVMELLEGEDLGRRAHRLRRLSLSDTARILTHVGKALKKAHEAGIVHRDLKPANLFLARVDDEEIVKVLDFGIAKEALGGPAGEATKTGEVVGSPHYMSPEQVRGDKDLDHRTDLWALGVIAFRLLTGTLPFQGEQIGNVLAKVLTEPLPRPTALAPDLPPSMDGFFLKALARDKTQRFQSIQEMLDGFAAAAGGREVLQGVSMSLGTGPVRAVTLPLPQQVPTAFAAPPQGPAPAPGAPEPQRAPSVPTLVPLSDAPTQALASASAPNPPPGPQAPVPGSITGSGQFAVPSGSGQFAVPPGSGQFTTAVAHTAPLFPAAPRSNAPALVAAILAGVFLVAGGLGALLYFRGAAPDPSAAASPLPSGAASASLSQTAALAPPPSSATAPQAGSAAPSTTATSTTSAVAPTSRSTSSVTPKPTTKPTTTKEKWF